MKKILTLLILGMCFSLTGCSSDDSSCCCEGDKCHCVDIGACCCEEGKCKIECDCEGCDCSK